MITIGRYISNISNERDINANFNCDTAFYVQFKNVQVLEIILIGRRILEELRR
jgi:hypothetical protein